MDTTVALKRENVRRKRLWRLVAVLSVLAAWFWGRVLSDSPLLPQPPSLGEDVIFWLPGMVIILLLGLVLVLPMLSNSKSPHVIYRPEQIEVGFQDVVGLGRVVDEVDHTLRIMLDHESFRKDMGGRPRRGVLFEGPPGTGKTHLAKALAKEAGVPFLFVSATAFQSMWFGMTARKIRAFFKAMRKAARKEGGAIGFIEEIDAIGLQRSGVSSMSETNLASTINRSVSSETGSMVNELLIQMQSFDEPSAGERFRGKFISTANLFLPPHRLLKKRVPQYSNILLIGATNRASQLDPALVRPGRFDRILHFDIPGRTARMQLLEYFLARKSHTDELNSREAIEDLASATLGYTPASIERLFDEALLLAVKDERNAMTLLDLRRARLEIEVGLPEPTDYEKSEAATIACHEAGHATAAYLVGKGRKLEVLSIIKRRDALGFLAHRLADERHTQRQSELLALIQISLGGMVAEEIFFGESGTGPGGDLIGATNVAVEMVGSLGMGGSLVSYRALEMGAIGGNLAAKVLSDKQGREDVDRILNDNKVLVTQLLLENRHIVEALRDALLDREELIDDEILDVIRAAEARHEATGAEVTVIDLRAETIASAAIKNEDRWAPSEGASEA